MLIGGFQPFTLSDFPGLTAAIIFTQGCNFRCPYCHNRPLWPLFPSLVSEMKEDDIYSFLDKRAGKLDGLVITGGEPTLHDDLRDFIKKVKSRGFRIKLDTNGSHPDVLEELISEDLLDYIAMDIKAPANLYDLLCGTPVEITLIRASQQLIASSGIEHHFRTTHYRKMLSGADIERIRQEIPPGSRYVVQECRDTT